MQSKRQSREKQNFAAFIFMFWKTPNDICIVKEIRSKSRFCWEMRSGSRNTLDFLRLWRSFRFFFGMKIRFIWGMFKHFTSVVCEVSQPLLFTPQKSTSMEVMLIFSHCEHTSGNHPEKEFFWDPAVWGLLNCLRMVLSCSLPPNY
jgi:hypothetical protein